MSCPQTPKGKGPSVPGVGLNPQPVITILDDPERQVPAQFLGEDTGQRGQVTFPGVVVPGSEHCSLAPDPGVSQRPAQGSGGTFLAQLWDSVSMGCWSPV
jgi:hypothetical protein